MAERKPTLLVNEADARVLGVAIANLRLDDNVVRLDDARMSSGWHTPEDGWRWTNGDAGLALAGAGYLGFDVVMTGTYWSRAQQKDLAA